MFLLFVMLSNHISSIHLLSVPISKLFTPHKLKAVQVSERTNQEQLHLLSKPINRYFLITSWLYFTCFLKIVPKDLVFLGDLLEKVLRACNCNGSAYHFLNRSLCKNGTCKSIAYSDVQHVRGVVTSDSTFFVSSSSYRLWYSSPTLFVDAKLTEL